MRRAPIVSALVVATCALFVGRALAQDEAPEAATGTGGEGTVELEAPKRSSWRVEITPYLWAPSLDTELRIGNLVDDVDVTAREVFENLDAWAVFGRIEGWRERFGLYLDGTYIETDGEFTAPTAIGTREVALDFDVALVDFGAGVRLLDLGADRDSALRFSADLFVGARYTELTQKIDATLFPPILPGRQVGDRQDWFDPTVGGRLDLFLTRWLSVSARGDVGGFGIGSAAELSYKAQLGLGFHVGPVALRLGYQVYGLDYDRGSGSQRIGFDGISHGPVLGLSFTFGG